MKARWSSCQAAVSRVIAEADNPAAEPKKPSSAGTKSPVESPCRYSSGKHLGDLRGPSAPRRDEPSCEPRLLPGRLVHPTVVHPRCFGSRLHRPRSWTFVRSGMAVSRHESVTVLVTLVRRARRRTRRPRPRAPRRASSVPPRDRFRPADRPSATAPSSFTTLSIGVPSSPAL